MTTREYRVLVADDDPTVGLLMQAALAGRGFSPTVVADGEAALAAFCQSPFDLVLLDVEMPKMGGFEVCAEIRRRVGSRLPVVLVSSHNDPSFHERLAACRAAHIAKPLDWSLLASRLTALLDGRSGDY